MSLPSDPLDALNWAWNHSGGAWWIIGGIAAAAAWINKRMREWSRRNALAVGPSKLKPAGMQWGPGTPAPQPAPAARPAGASAYAAAPSYVASGYAAQPAYAAPPPAVAPHTPARKLYREGAPAQRTVAPVARSVDVPGSTATGRWTLAGAFGDPAHARTAIVVAEVLGPPVGLR